MNRLFTFVLFFFAAYVAAAQTTQPPFTPATDRIRSFAQRGEAKAASIADGIAFRNIGPTVMSGRVADIDVSPADPSHFYVGYASGGLWKTENNGTSFKPLFDKEMVMTIGDIAVNWQRNIIWVGTGEVNSSRSSYSGTGVFKSTDGGKTWQHLGLGESHHIGRIVRPGWRCWAICTRRILNAVCSKLPTGEKPGAKYCTSTTTPARLIS